MKYVTVKPDFIAANVPSGAKVLGAKVVDGDKAVIAIKEGANTIVKFIDNIDFELDKIIESIIEEGTALYLKIEAFFNDIFNVLPTYIVKNNERFQLTLLPSRGKEQDFVSYVNFGMMGSYSILFKVSGRNMFKAKNEMHKLLEEKQFL